MNIIKERAHRILTTDKAYRDEEVKYLWSIMKSIDQEDLIQHLTTLNYPELKAVVSCGVPGHAQTHALQMLKTKRDALDAFVASDGVEAIMETNVEDQEGKENDSSERVRSSESRRESDSETLGDEDPDTGTSRMGRTSRRSRSRSTGVLD